jgi:hypothetical protein
MGPLGELGRVLVSEAEAERGEYRQRTRSKRVVIEALGDLDGRTRVLLRPGPAFREAPETCDTKVNHRLERCMSCRLSEGFEQQGDHACLGVSEVGQEVERLGALST